MSMLSRFGMLAVGFALVVAVGCDSKGTSGASAGGGSEKYGSKLVGTCEDTTEKKDEGITVEFKADGGMKIVMGPFDMSGTYKVTKEDGKVVTVETEMESPFGKDKGTDKKTFTVTFEDADTITMTPADKPDPKKLKRKK